MYILGWEKNMKAHKFITVGNCETLLLLKVKWIH